MGCYEESNSILARPSAPSLYSFLAKIQQISPCCLHKTSVIEVYCASHRHLLRIGGVFCRASKDLLIAVKQHSILGMSTKQFFQSLN